MYTVTIKTETRPFGLEYVAYDRHGNWRTRGKANPLNLLTGRHLAEWLFHKEEIAGVCIGSDGQTEVLIKEFPHDDKPELSETPGPWRIVKSAGGFLILGANGKIVDCLTANQEVDGQLLAQAWELREMVAKLQEELNTLKAQLQEDGDTWQAVKNAGETLEEIRQNTDG